jgi:hypothetical protein
MKFDLIHIGMMKTATTYFQNIWLRNNKYNLSHKGSLDFLEKQRNSVRFNKGIPERNIKFDRKYSTNRSSILSNEGFSTAFLNEYKNQERIPEFIQKTSYNLFNLGENCGLLVLVRNPLDWIKSIYIQSIKEGNSEDIQKFINEQILFLYHSLNLKHIINSYSRYFNNILVLPFELLKEDEDKLWQTISHKFNVPLVENRMQKLNVSLDEKRVFLLSKMNEMSNKTVNILADCFCHIKMKEKKIILLMDIINQKNGCIGVLLNMLKKKKLMSFIKFLIYLKMMLLMLLMIFMIINCLKI